MRTRRKRRVLGSTLVTAMILSFLLFVLSAGFLLLISTEYRSNHVSCRSAAALNLAEAGTDYAFYAISSSARINDGTWLGTNPKTKAITGFATSSGETLGDFDISATSGAGNGWVVQSTGYVPSRTAATKTSRTVIAKIEPGASSGPFSMGFFGNDEVKVAGNVISDSYDSRNGVYGGANIGENGDVGTNGSKITITGSGDIKGDLLCFGDTSEGKIDMSGSGTVTGDIITKGTSGLITMTGSGTVNGNISTTGSASAKIDMSGTYVINGSLISSGTGSGAVTMTGSGTVSGDAATGPGGTANIGGSSSIGGSITHAQSVESPEPPKELPPVVVPSNLVSSGYPSWQSDGLLTRTGSSTATIPAGDWKLRRLKLTGSSIVNIGAEGQETNIYLTGYLSKGIDQSGSSVINCYGKVTFYTDADVDSSGSGLWNPANTPTNCIIWGTPTCTNVHISGSRDLYGAVYAPNAHVHIAGSGVTCGAYVGKDIQFNGSGGFHYDEALGAIPGGAPSGYKVVYWQEKE